MYVMNGRNEQVHVLDHASGKILSSFGRPGHWLGNFTHGHAIAVDSGGNLYVAETDTGRRMQKFRLVIDATKQQENRRLGGTSVASSGRRRRLARKYRQKNKTA